MKLVGLSGFAGSGKDAAAQVFMDAGYTRVAFADVLRRMAYAIDPYVRENTETDDELFIFCRLSEVIDNYGWDDAKNLFPDVRRLLQRLGTEAGRDLLGENIWVDTAFSLADSDRIVVTDVRFINELRAIKSRGGYTIRIDRPGVGPRNDHPSETALSNAPFDVTIVNDGTLEDLHERVLGFARKKHLFEGDL